MSDLLAAAGLSGVQFTIATVVMFSAALVRGYSGFGFSMVAVTGLTLLRPPAEIVPMVLLLEILASLHMLPGVWRHIDWHSLRWLFLGMITATPLGVWVLASVPANGMRVIVSVLVLVAAAALWSGWSLRRRPSPSMTLATGALAGLLNGSASIAGPPVILFYFASPAGMAVSRASMITFFLAADIITLVFGGIFGLLTAQAWRRALLLIVPVIAGIAIGSRRFGTADPVSFRRAVLVLLMLLAVAGLLRAALS